MTGVRQIRRRRAIAILGAVAGLPLWHGRTGAVPVWSWQGLALGAAAEIRICHPDRAAARDLVEACVAEVRRLEAAFSLFLPDSELSRLNADGRIDHPSRDFLALMELARLWSECTDGAFDATVQPLWRLYAEHFAQAAADPNGPPPAAIAAARALVDYRAVDASRRRIVFARPGMAVTLNGIAQGYIADRVVDRLLDDGIRATMVETGEVRALGSRPDGFPWRVGVPRPDGGVAATIPLRDRAVATSAGAGTPFTPDRRFHHLLVPRSGACANHVAAVSAIASTATAADALSTALYVVPAAEAPALLQRARALCGDVDALLQEAGGGTRWLGSSTSPNLKHGAVS